MLVWKAYSRMIDALAFSPDGRTLAVGGYRLACRLIDPTTGDRRWTLPATQSFGLSLAFLPDGSVLCKNSSMAIIDAKTSAEVRKCGSWCRAFALAPDGRTAFVADGGHQDLVRRYDLDSGASRGEIELESGAINRIAVSPDGKLVGVVGCKQFFLLDADTLAVVASDAQRALSNGAFALAFCPRGRMVVYSAGRTLFVWNTTTARSGEQGEPGREALHGRGFHAGRPPLNHREQGRHGPRGGGSLGEASGVHRTLGLRTCVRVGRRPLAGGRGVARRHPRRDRRRHWPRGSVGFGRMNHLPGDRPC